MGQAKRYKGAISPVNPVPLPNQMTISPSRYKRVKVATMEINRPIVMMLGKKVSTV